MYNLRIVYDAFTQAGQETVSIDFEDSTSVTEAEIQAACDTVTWETLEPILQSLTNAEPLKELRATRDALIAKTDWVVTKALEAGVQVPQEWQTYRQALRDITNTYTSLEDVVWPTKPE